MNGIDVLIQKLDGFIRKYYKNQLVKGGIYSLTLLCSFFLVAVLMEYFGKFDTIGRSVLFYGYLTAGISILVFYVLIPLSKLTRLGNVISYEQAAQIVGNHFGDIKDKIINTLQLNQRSVSAEQSALVAASIDQRVRQLTPVPFTTAIDISENKKYLKYLIIPLLILLLISVWDINIITSSAGNIINHDTYIPVEAKYQFEIQNDELSVLQQEDFQLTVKVEGKQVPNEVYIEVDNRKHKLKKINNIEFSYTFRNVQESKDFQLKAEDVQSETYTLNTIPKPTLKGFEIVLDYPDYTGLKDEKLVNVGDLTLPEGTRAKWFFDTKNTRIVAMSFADTMLQLDPLGENTFQHERSLFKSSSYTVSTQNEFTTNKDSISYFLNVVSDILPTIQVEEKLDSGNNFIRYFNGNINDDYGFTKLVFTHQIIVDGKGQGYKSATIPIAKNYNKEQFFHYFDLSELNLDPGDKVEYYFTVWDNDGINGPKSARSQTKLYKAPTKQELADKADQSSEKIKDDFSESAKELQDLKDELKQIQKDLLEKQSPDWQDKNKIENFLQKQQSLQNTLEELKQENQRNLNEQNEYKEPNPEILKKQEMLNELFDQLMTPEMKKLYEELQKMLEEMNKNQLLNKMEEIEMSQEQIEKELDRSIEMFKQMEFEQKLDDITERLDQLAEDQKQLSEDTKEKNKSNFDLNKEQEKLNEEFSDIQQEMDELEELNEDLEQKKNMLDTEQEQQDIQENMKNSQDDLGEKKNKKASEKQQEAGEQMEQLSQMMKNMKQKEQEQDDQENMQALRQLLENLIQFSFEQEEVMDEFMGLNPNDPKYVKLGQQQRKLQDDAKVLEDSLFALSKRIMQLSPYINKEVAEMNKNIKNSLKHISERQTPMAVSKQQYVMTSTNNLALLFDEAMKQMQQAMKNKMPGTGQCSKPGGSGSPSPSSMKQMQKQMQKQLEKMKKAMEQGKKDGGKKPGGKQDGGKKPGGQKPGGTEGGPGMGGMMSKELAQMAAQQEALRKEIQRLSQELNKDGSGMGNGLKEIAKQMEKVEEDIVNKRITQETLNRQKDIMTRLLEHEKADREREYDNKRESKESKNQLFSNPNEYLEYKRLKEKEVELLKTIPPSLKPYYKNKVNEYFNHIDD